MLNLRIIYLFGGPSRISLHTLIKKKTKQKKTAAAVAAVRLLMPGGFMFYNIYIIMYIYKILLHRDTR